MCSKNGKHNALALLPSDKLCLGSKERVIGHIRFCLVHFHLGFLSYYLQLILFLIRPPLYLMKKSARSPQQASRYFQSNNPSWF